MSNTRVPLFDIFAGKRVFVTGHTGFKGSWLSLWLSQLGSHVAGYSLEPPTNPSNFIVSGIEDRLVKSTIGDLRDYQRLHDAIAEFEPDLIMHLAAQSVVKRGYQNPLETISTNVMGTANVLESIRMLGMPCAVFCVTSDKCYFNKEQPWGYRETDEMGDLDPYGGSKGAAELIIRSFRESYFPIENIDEHRVWLASGRAGNVIGGGDWTDHALVVDCIKAFHELQAVSIRNPLAQRPWQHVLQCLSGYMTVSANLLARTNKQICSGWNFGPLPGNELPVSEVVRLLADYWGGGQWIVESKAGHKREAQILRLAIDKAIWELDWRPAWNVTESLQKTVQWYQEYFDPTNHAMQDFSLRQIREFELAMVSRNPESVGQLA
ncbi:MAG: CDP-glucose 4,6-dehydratase [Planctomycetota bacterium]